MLPLRVWVWLKKQFEWVKPYLLFIVQVLMWIFLFMYFKFWIVMLILLVVYTAIGFYNLWREPLIFYTMEVYAIKWEGGKSDKWYARVIRYISKPIYWLVDKAKENYERREQRERESRERSGEV